MKKINIVIVVMLLLQVFCIAGTNDKDNAFVKMFTPDSNNVYVGWQEKRSGNWEARHYEMYPSSNTVGFVRGTDRASWLNWVVNYSSTSIVYSDAAQM